MSTVELPAADGPTLTLFRSARVWRIRVQVDDAAGSDVAEIAFEAVGEPIPAVGDTDTDSDADTDAVPRKCGCDHGGIPWLGAWAILLVVRRARAVATAPVSQRARISAAAYIPSVPSTSGRACRSGLARANAG